MESAKPNSPGPGPAIRITPEMIEAGEDALRGSDVISDSPFITPAMVRNAVQDMLAAALVGLRH
jgi:hypothetical protein